MSMAWRRSSHSFTEQVSFWSVLFAEILHLFHSLLTTLSSLVACGSQYPHSISCRSLYSGRLATALPYHVKFLPRWASVTGEWDRTVVWDRSLAPNTSSVYMLSAVCGFTYAMRHTTRNAHRQLKTVPVRLVGSSLRRDGWRIYRHSERVCWSLRCPRTCAVKPCLTALPSAVLIVQQYLGRSRRIFDYDLTVSRGGL